MTTRRHRIRAFEWTSLTTIGLASGLVGGVLAGMPLGRILNAMVVTAVVTCLVGAALGGFQAITLRRILRKPLWWVVATVCGLGVGLAGAVVVVEQGGILLTGSRPQLAHLTAPMRALSFVIVGLVAGAALGLAQALVFRLQLPAITHWVPANAIGLAIAFSASSLLIDLSGMPVASTAGAITFVLLSGALFGALTSRPLLRAA